MLNCCFFFQAEDGIRDLTVTGVQTCALPIFLFTPEAQTRDVLGLLRARGLNGVHAVELAPALLRTRDWAGLKRLVFEENDGFWLLGEAGGAKTPGRLPADSLVRLLRRLAR